MKHHPGKPNKQLMQHVASYRAYVELVRQGKTPKGIPTWTISVDDYPVTKTGEMICLLLDLNDKTFFCAEVRYTYHTLLDHVEKDHGYSATWRPTTTRGQMSAEERRSCREYYDALMKHEDYDGHTAEAESRSEEDSDSERGAAETVVEVAEEEEEEEEEEKEEEKEEKEPEATPSPPPVKTKA
ncbi:hypothetical protein LTR53_009434 [Teratosphaeriaceae sp. CCFEE 6253]|nr:hypothetical protein LTR53_009434 [Teratosphaeriaceae sp. CCFEE 6253]